MRGRVVQRKDDSKRRIEVRTGANGIRGLGEVLEEALRKHVGQWLKRFGPCLPFRALVHRQLCTQLQQPRPSVRAFEPRARRMRGVCCFNRNIGGREMFIEQGANVCGLRQ